MSGAFTHDGQRVAFTDGQTVLQAADAAGLYVPHLCSRPDLPFEPHGSCRVCLVKVDGHMVTSCTLPAREGLVIESETDEVNGLRRQLVQLLFAEGNHFCPSCEKSGDCTLQALGYRFEMATPHFPQAFPDRPVDASHPEVLLDFNRCILCELCVRASAEIDQKHVFALAGRGAGKHLIVDAESGRLGDTAFAATDTAAQVCPVGVILKKGRGFAVPIGERRFDRAELGKKR